MLEHYSALKLQGTNKAVVCLSFQLLNILEEIMSNRFQDICQPTWDLQAFIYLFFLFIIDKPEHTKYSHWTYNIATSNLCVLQGYGAKE